MLKHITNTDVPKLVLTEAQHLFLNVLYCYWCCSSILLFKYFDLWFWTSFYHDHEPKAMAFWMIWAAVSLHPYPSESLSDERFSFNQSLVLILIRAAVFNSFHLNDSRRKQGIRLALMSKIWKRAWNYNTKKNNM